MRSLIFILMLGLLSCGAPLAEDKKSTEIVDVESDSTKSNFQNAYIKIAGDFDGDGKSEWAYQYISKQQIGSPQDGGKPAEYNVFFSNESLGQINMDCCEFRLVNERDLNNVPGDEISIFQDPLNGCTNIMSTYTYINGNWKKLIQPFLIPTGCEYFSDSTIQARIVKENETIYYYETDANDFEWTLIKKKAAILK